MSEAWADRSRGRVTTSEIAYTRVTAADAIHIWLVDVASGRQRDIYAGEPGERIEHLAVSDGNVSFRIGSSVCCIVPFGLRYTVGADGSNPHALDDPPRAWDVCGPDCGMPPEGYEDEGGLAQWCEQLEGGCFAHFVYVDRDNQQVHELYASSDYLVGATSPDRTTVALLRPDGLNQVLRIIRLDDFSYNDIDLGFTYLNNVAWLPDGAQVLLYIAGLH